MPEVFSVRDLANSMAEHNYHGYGKATAMISTAKVETDMEHREVTRLSTRQVREGEECAVSVRRSITA